jgi:hypothetical protein
MEIKRALAGAIVVLSLCSCGVLIKEELPVQFTYRPSLAGEGAVVQVHNESEKRLVLEAEIVVKATGEVKKLAVSLGPYEVTEIGWMQGHAFAAGDKITVRHEKYAESSLVVP